MSLNQDSMSFDEKPSTSLTEIGKPSSGHFRTLSSQSARQGTPKNQGIQITATIP
jgi:hypothetical protein